MNIIVSDNYTLMSARAADFVIDLIADQPEAVLALPTGNTPLGMYQELSEECRQGELKFKQTRTFNLDDYVGVPKDHPASFFVYMKKNFFSLVDLRPENIYMLDGTAPDLHWVCEDYERSLEEVGGLDLAILGIGLSGHIAYNEPGTDFASRTHVVDLAEISRQSLIEHFGDQAKAPKQGITMGIGTIMSAKKILLLANGSAKKDIIEKSLHGPITPDVPASVLQNHPDLTVILDKEAAGR